MQEEVGRVKQLVPCCNSYVIAEAQCSGLDPPLFWTPKFVQTFVSLGTLGAVGCHSFPAE